MHGSITNSGISGEGSQKQSQYSILFELDRFVTFLHFHGYILHVKQYLNISGMDSGRVFTSKTSMSALKSTAN